MGLEWKLEEERRFLADPAASLGPKATQALEAIAQRMDMDFAGIDFSVTPDGDVLVFEANATMSVYLPEAEEAPDKRAYAQVICDAFGAMLERHADSGARFSCRAAAHRVGNHQHRAGPRQSAIHVRGGTGFLKAITGQILAHRRNHLADVAMPPRPADRLHDVSNRLLRKPNRRCRMNEVIWLNGEIIPMSEARISPDGTISDLQTVSTSDPDFELAAAVAIRQWEFTPTLLNCVAIEVPMKVHISFRAQ